MNRLFTLLFLLCVTTTSNAQFEWKVDQGHSNIGFKVKHLVVSTVRGNFDEYTISITSGSYEDFSNATLTASLKAASINTNHKGRDDHLRSDDFLNAEEFPEITFVSKSFTKKGDDKYSVLGDLTIRDVTKEVELEAVFNGVAKARNRTVCSFDVTGEIDRFDFNVKFDRLIETGGLVAGKMIVFDFNLELRSIESPK